METVRTINGVNAKHLDAVKSAMVELGSPVIRVVDCGDYYFAIEGSHRVAAAAALGVAVELDVVGAEEVVLSSTLDFGWLEKPGYTGAQLVEMMMDRCNAVYMVEVV